MINRQTVPVSRPVPVPNVYSLFQTELWIRIWKVRVSVFIEFRIPIQNTDPYPCVKTVLQFSKKNLENVLKTYLFSHFMTFISGKQFIKVYKVIQKSKRIRIINFFSKWLFELGSGSRSRSKTKTF